MFIRLTRLDGRQIAVAEEAIDYVEPLEVPSELKTALYIRGEAIPVREDFETVMRLLEPDPDF